MSVLNPLVQVQALSLFREFTLYKNERSEMNVEILLMHVQP